MSTDLSNSLLKAYTDILGNGELSDTEISVGKERDAKLFRLHSFILKVCSPYFRDKLSSNSIKIENDIIKFQISNINANVFEILMKYIYGDTLLNLANNNVKTNVELLIAADELRLTELCIFIEEHLLENKGLLTQNFVLIQHTAKQFDQFKKLSQFYKEKYQQDSSLIFKANDFTNIKQKYLLELLTENTHSLKQIEVWDKLTIWAIAQSNELTAADITNWTDEKIMIFRTLVNPFIPHIKFEEISREDFFQKIKPLGKIFDDKFYIKILESCCFNFNK